MIWKRGDYVSAIRAQRERLHSRTCCLNLSLVKSSRESLYIRLVCVYEQIRERAAIFIIRVTCAPYDRRSGGTDASSRKFETPTFKRGERTAPELTYTPSLVVASRSSYVVETPSFDLQNRPLLTRGLSSPLCNKQGNRIQVLRIPPFLACSLRSSFLSFSLLLPSPLMLLHQPTLTLFLCLAQTRAYFFLCSLLLASF